MDYSVFSVGNVTPTLRVSVIKLTSDPQISEVDRLLG